MSDNPTPALAPEVSPLLEADPNSVNILTAERIDDIFNKKPILLTDADLQQAVEYYRRERDRYKVESQEKDQKKTAAGPRRRAGPAPKSVSEALQSGMDLL